LSFVKIASKRFLKKSELLATSAATAVRIGSWSAEPQLPKGGFALNYLRSKSVDDLDLARIENDTAVNPAFEATTGFIGAVQQ
jgi:hypothetical protein